MDKPFLVLAFCACMLGYAGYRIWKLIDISRRRSAGKSWPLITGEVVDKNINIQSDQESGSSYYPEVRYRYKVMGRDYEKQVTLHGIFTYGSAGKALARIGDTIEVRYNPEKPEENFTRIEKIAFGDILIIVTLVGFSLFLLIDIPS